MKLIRTFAILLLACGVAAGFPKTSPRTALKETFTGGADSFDLNLHSLTLVPYDLGNGNNHFRYPSYYSIRPIRSLPVDMSESSSITPTNGTYPVISLLGLPTIHNIPLSNFQITYDGAVILKNSNSSSIVTLNVLKSTDLGSSSDELNLAATYVQIPGGKLVIQFDYSLDPTYASTSNDPARLLARNTFQVEIFPSGMIRYSYFSVDVTVAEVGLFSTTSSSTGGDLNFSTAILKAPDVVRSEDAGTAAITLELPATEAVSFQYATLSGSAVAPSDYTATSGISSISTGAMTTSVAVPITNDNRGETAESLDLVIHSPGNPDWIFAEPRIWILDDDTAAAGSGPRIDLSGNRVIVLPPDPSTVTITGFRLLSLTGGTLLNPLDQSPVIPYSTFSLQAGAAGLIASGLGIHLTVEAIHSGGTSTPVGFDLDGINSSPVFNFTSDKVETTEGGFASVGVSASLPEASVSYQILPLSALPTADYAPAPKTLEFKDGLAMIEIPVFADGVTEGNEEFLVRLIHPSPGAFIGPASRARVVIADGSGGLRSPTDQLLPDPRPTGRSMNRHLTNGDWRFVGEPLWRPARSHGWNLREGLHQVEFRANTSPWKLYMAPESYLYQGTNFSGITDLSVEYANFTPVASPAPGGSTGSLKVDLLPAETTGKWRRVGTSNWLNSGFTETLVPIGSHLTEFQGVSASHDTPSVRSVLVLSGPITSITAKYQPRPVVGVDPVAVVEPDLRSTVATAWTRIPISTQTGNFKVSFEYRPSSSTDGWIGLTSSMASAETDLVSALKTTTAGFTVLSGSAYEATGTLAPVANQWHFIEFEVFPATSTYNLHVTPPVSAVTATAARVTIRSGASFRTTTPPTAAFSYLSMSSSSGLQSVRSLRVENSPASSTWKIIEFPDQRETFDLAVELQVRTKQLPSTNDFPFSFGLSDGRSAIPTHSFGPFNFPQPTNLGASGRLAPIAARMHVDLIAHTYEIHDGSNVIGRGTIPPTLTKANHFYVFTTLATSSNSADIEEFRIANSVLPPAYAPPAFAGAPSRSHLPITPQTGRFSMTCDIRTVETVGASSLIDSLVGFSANKVLLDSQIAVGLRALLPSTGDGSWDAHSGGDFIKEGDLPIVNGKLYHATFHVDVPAKTFRISIAPEDGGPVVILDQGTFRDPATELRYLTLRRVQGRLEVSNVRGPLPHPLDSPAYFTGQIETPNGFGTGTVVADHVVMTSARLVIDSTTGTFTRGITWQRSEGGYSAIPDACEPSHILLPAKYSAGLLNTSDGDLHDVALLVFRPLDVPESDNAPGGGCFSGFQIDDGSGSWTTTPVKRFFSFPVSGITAGNLGKVHSTDMSAVSFSGAGVLKTASGVRTPPGSEGAAVFVQGSDKAWHPAAVCIGAADGTSRFRTIDAEIAEAIYQANSYQRQPGFLQGLLKGGVYYISQTVEKSTESSRVHILSNALPPTATWTVKRTSFGPTLGPFPGGLNFVGDPATYIVTFGAAPTGFSGPTIASKTSSLVPSATWNLPAVYTPNPPASYETWVDAHYDEFEAASPVAAPSAQTPWLGVDNLTAYAFGFDPNLGPTRFATATTPGFPVVTVTPPAIVVEFLKRTDSGLNYEIQYSDTLADWTTITPAATAISLTGWKRVSWTSPSLPGQPGRKFVRTRVTLTE